MPWHFFKIPANAPSNAQLELNAFCNSHKIISVNQQFVVDGQNSFWAFAVDVAQQASTVTRKSTSRIDYREVLNAKDFAVYSQLRDLRKSLALRDGIEIFQVFTNSQLAEIVTSGAKSLDDLKRIDGIGPSRLKSYGADVLAVVANSDKDEGQSVE